MAKKREEQIETSAIDIITNSLVSDLNRNFKKELGGEDAAFMASDSAMFAEVTDYVSTGLDILDIAIANTPNGGCPVGRIVEITGLAAAGKSLLATYLLKSTQKKNGIAVYIDTENAISRKYMTAIGVDVDKLVYIPLVAMEDIFEAIERMIVAVREKQKDILLTIVVDSVMGATTKIEQAAGYDKDGYATQKSIIISKGMRKLTHMIGKQKVLLVFTNQLRENLGAMGFGAEKYKTSGGMGIAFHSSVRLRLSNLGKIKKIVNGIDNVVGIKTECKVVKNRLGPPLKSVKFDIYYESGVDNYGSWLTTLKDYKIVSQGGAFYTLKFPEMEIVDLNGEISTATELKFQSKDFKRLMESNASLKKHVYDIVCEKYIMTYKNGDDYGIDDVEISDGDYE